MFEPFSDLQLREMEDARKNLKRLERRDSWLWWSAITVMLLLTLAVIAVSLPGILKESDQTFQLNFSLAIHALVGLCCSSMSTRFTSNCKFVACRTT